MIVVRCCHPVAVKADLTVTVCWVKLPLTRCAARESNPQPAD